MSSSVFHEGFVVDSNHAGAKDPLGQPWGVNYVHIRMPWRASLANPDPVSNHPVPVYVNRHHTPDRQDWDILPPGTRVLVVDTDKRRGINEMGMAVIGYGPAITDMYEDLRQTSHYHHYPDGHKAKIVDDMADPIAGKNEDVGLTLEGPEGEGVTTRRPWEDDPLRRESEVRWPGAQFALSQEHKLDNTAIFLQLLALISGGFLRFEQTTSPENWFVELNDGQGQQIKMTTRPSGAARFQIISAPSGAASQLTFDFDPIAGTLLLDVVGGAMEVSLGPSLLSLLLGGGASIVSIAGGGAAVARMGDAVVVDPNTGIGAITGGSAKVSSG